MRLLSERQLRLALLAFALVLVLLTSRLIGGSSISDPAVTCASCPAEQCRPNDRGDSGCPAGCVPRGSVVDPPPTQQDGDQYVCQPRDNYLPTPPATCSNLAAAIRDGVKRNPLVTDDEAGKVQPPMRDIARKLVGQPEPRRYRTCAVVGNSGISAKAYLGAEIDAHDMVLRINLGPTWGYEQHVGRKVTHRLSFPPFCGAYASHERVRNLCVRCLDNQNLANQCDVSRQVVATQSKETAGIWKLFKLGNLPASELVAISPTWMSWVKRIVPNPSTGLYGILYAVKHCDSVDVYGFDMGKIGRDVPKLSYDYAYFPDPNTLSGRKGDAGTYHDFSKEQCFLSQLATMGLIRDRYPFCTKVSAS